MKNTTFILSMLFSIAGFAQSYPVLDSTANTKIYLVDTISIVNPLKDYSDDASIYSFLADRLGLHFSLNMDKDINIISVTPIQGTIRLNDKSYNAQKYYSYLPAVTADVLDSIIFTCIEGANQSNLIEKKIYDRNNDTIVVDYLLSRNIVFII